ncbi:MAG: ATP-binding cassette domain-containing protein [Mycoplasmatales bacterium]
MLKINIIEKKFQTKGQEKKVLENINLELKAKEKYLLVGKNGRGKTTLLNIITLLDKDYQGEVYFHDVPTKEIKNKADFRYQNITYISQDMSLFNNLTIEENINTLLNSYDKHLFQELITNFRLKKLLNKKYSLLSGGERQKTNLVFGLLQNKKLLILDEPTNNLDKKSKLFLYEYLKTIKNQTLIVVDHGLNNELMFTKISLDNSNEPVIVNEVLDKSQEKTKKYNLKTKNILKIHFKNFQVYKYNYFISLFIIVCLTLLGSSYLLNIQDLQKKLALNMLPNSVVVLNQTDASYCQNHKEECLSNKVYFSNNDLSVIQKNYNIQTMQVFNRYQEMNVPIQNQAKIISEYLYLKDLDLSLLKNNQLISEYAKQLNLGTKSSIEVQSTELLNNKKVFADNPFLLQEYNYKNMLMGELPQDNTEDEVMIDETLATYIMQNKQLNSLNDVLNLELEIPTKELDWEDANYNISQTAGEKTKIKIVGIYESIDKYKSNIIYRYNEQDLVFSKIQESMQNLQSKKEYFNRERERFGYEKLDTAEINSLFGDGIKNIYIEFSDKTEQEKFIKEFQEKYPYFTLYSDNEILTSDSMLESKQSIKKLTKFLILILIISIILFALINKGSNILLQKERKLLNLIGLNKKAFLKYQVINQLTIGLISVLLTSPLLIYFKVQVYFSVVIYLVILMGLNLLIKYIITKR